MAEQELLDTLWEVPDDLWAEIAPLIAELDPSKSTGKKRQGPRRMLNGIIFRLRSGCQWNQLPRSLGMIAPSTAPSRGGSRLGCLAGYGSGSSPVTRNWVGWIGNGSRRTGRWARPVWGDAIGRNPTDRGKPGSKRSILVEADGGPLSIVAAGANVHDTKLLAATLESIVVERPTPTEEQPQHLCLDKGYDNPTGRETARHMAMKPTSGALGRRSWTHQVRKGIRRAGGWWNGTWPGCRNAGPCWCDTTKRSGTTWDCSSWRADYCGIAAGGGSPAKLKRSLEIVSNSAYHPHRTGPSVLGTRRDTDLAKANLGCAFGRCIQACRFPVHLFRGCRENYLARNSLSALTNSSGCSR